MLEPTFVPLTLAQKIDMATALNAIRLVITSPDHYAVYNDLARAAESLGLNDPAVLNGLEPFKELKWSLFRPE